MWNNAGVKRQAGLTRVVKRASQQGVLYRRFSMGFTLVEIMVAVVIVSVLSAIALGSYRSSVLKSNHSTAKSALLDLASREERFFTLNNTYSSTLSDLYGSGTGLTFPISEPLTGTASYQLNAPTVVAANPTSGTPATFTITASPVGSQTKDTCGTFTLTSIGQQTVSGSGSCW